MKSILSFILTTRWHAIGIALLCASLALLGIPLVDWISISILSLVTLTKGPLEGLWLLLFILVPNISFLFFHHEPHFPVAAILIGDMLVNKGGTYLISLYIRRTANWENLFFGLTCTAILLVCIVHSFMPNIDVLWQNVIIKFFTPMMNSSGSPNPEFELAEYARHIAPFATGILLTLIISGLLAYVMIGRAAQSALFSPGSFRVELNQFYIPRLFLVLCLLIGILPIFDILWIRDLFFLAGLPLILDGLLTLNYYIAKTKTPFIWYILTYAVLLLTSILGVTVLIILAIVDSLYHLRSVNRLKIR